MKKLLFLAICQWQFVIMGQQISKVEYFVNTDPGFGLATTIPLPVDDSTAFVLDVTELSDGLNKLYIRTQDSDGKWSQTECRPFLKQEYFIHNLSNALEAEYFIDSEPGFGKGKELIGFNGDSLNFIIDLSEIEDGLHTLYLRMLDSKGKWSQTQNRPFLKSKIQTEDLPDIAYGEYFIDMVGDYGEGIRLDISNPSNNGLLDILVDLIGIPLGNHTLYIRVMDSKNNWGMVQNIGFTVCPYIQTEIMETICQGESYIFGTQTLTTEGEYMEVFQSATGCDSTVELSLSVNPSYQEIAFDSICEGESYSFGSQTLTFAGEYSELFQSATGCDSTVTLNLTIKQPTTSSMNQTACESYTINGETYTTSGVYEQMLTNVAGCDSTITLNLTINQPTTSSINQIACESFTLNGETYTTSGIYTQMLINATGCDSTLTLNLTINQPTTSLMNQTACESYTINGETYTTSGLYTQMLTNAAGCDSTLMLNLIINQPTTSSINETACESFTLNSVSYTESGVYEQALTNATGCDSIITLNLTINKVDATVVVDEKTITATATGASYQWIDCDNSNAIIVGETSQSFIATVSGNYAVIVSINGCNDTSICTSIVVIGIDGLINEKDFVVYPNPANDFITIEIKPHLVGSDFTITDILGNSVLIGKLTSEISNINIARLTGGIYLINLGVNNRKVFNVTKK